VLGHVEASAIQGTRMVMLRATCHAADCECALGVALLGGMLQR
jgi:hypothetical protein